MWKQLLILVAISTSALAQTRVAVIDTGLDLDDPRFKSHLCSTGHRDFTNSTLNDAEGHGTHIVGLIQEYAKDADYCLLIYKFYQEDSGNTKREVLAIKEAIKNHANVINFSGGGPGFNDEEYEIIKHNPKIIFIVAAGNEGVSLAGSTKDYYYPASYGLSYGLSNIIAVGNLSEDNVRNPTSNYSERLVWEIGTNVVSTLPEDHIGIMTGTSQATAIHTGKFLRPKIRRGISKSKVTYVR